MFYFCYGVQWFTAWETLLYIIEVIILFFIWSTFFRNIFFINMLSLCCGLLLLFYWFAFVLRSGYVHCKLLASTIKHVMYYSVKRHLTLLFYWFAFVLRSGYTYCKLLVNSIIMYVLFCEKTFNFVFLLVCFCVTQWLRPL